MRLLLTHQSTFFASFSLSQTPIVLSPYSIILSSTTMYNYSTYTHTHVVLRPNPAKKEKKPRATRATQLSAVSLNFLSLKVNLVCVGKKMDY